MHDRFHSLNDSSRWTPNIRPPYLDVEWWQKQIDQIVGKNRDGKSIIRLAWAPDVDGDIVVNERTKRYWIRRIKDGESWLYISPPRWVLERRLEKSAYYEAHQQTRFQINGTTGAYTDLGEPPDDFYVFDDGSLIADHDQFHGLSDEPKCCDTAWEGDTKYDLNGYVLEEKKVNKHRRCWGYYREPDQRDLDRIAESTRTRDKGKYFDPYSPLSQEQLALIAFEANVQTQRVEQESQEQADQVSKDYNKSMGWILGCDDPTTRRHGRYHFQNFNTVTGETLNQSAWQRSESGLYVNA